MDVIKRIMVGLDLTEMDDTLLKYTIFLCNQSAIKEVYLVHAEKGLDLPHEIAGTYKAAGESVTERVKARMDSKAAILANALPHVAVAVLLPEGNMVKELLLASKKEDVNLLIVGRKLQLPGSGMLPLKLLRSGRISVLFVPEKTEPVLRKIMVSLDFSEYSILALERVLHSAIALPEIAIDCLHVYQVPSGYITLGYSYSDFDAKMKELATEKFEKILERFPELKGRATLKLAKQERDENIGKLIMLEAKRADADLLVIGAKGKSAAALFILGSTTEKVLRYDNDIPLLVFKNKREPLGFLDALLQA